MTSIPPSLATFRILATAVAARWRVVLTATVVTPIVAVAVVTAVPEQFRATAKVLVQENRVMNPLLSDMPLEWSVNSRINVILTVLRSHSTIERVLRELGQIGAQESPAEIDAKVQAFDRAMNAFNAGSGIVEMRVTDKSPDAAYSTLKVLVETFFAEMRRPQEEALTHSAEFLRGQLERLRSEIGVLEQKVTSFKTVNADELPEVYKTNVDAHLGVQRQFQEAQGTLAAALRQKKAIEERLRSHSPPVLEIDAQLRRARARLEALRASKSDTDPEIAAAQALVRDLEQNRAAALADSPLDLQALEARGPARSFAGADLSAYKALLSQIDGARAKIAVLEGHLRQAEAAVRGSAANEPLLNAMSRELDSKAKVYGELLAKYEDALVKRELARYEQIGQVRTIDPPVRPTLSTRPSRTLVALGGLLAGILLGILLAALGEWGSGLVRPDRVHDLAGAPIIGEMRHSDAA